MAKVVNLSAIEGATPSPFVYMLDGYGIKWSGKLLPSVSGEYTIIPQSNDRSMIKSLSMVRKYMKLPGRKSIWAMEKSIWKEASLPI